MTSANPRARHHVLGIVALSLFAALFTRLWYLQVLTTDDAIAAVDSARTQTVIIEAPRGRILDRSGKVLVENRRTIQIQVDYQDFVDLDRPEQEALLRRLSQEITQDELLRYANQRAPDDPGARPEETETEATETEAGTEDEGPDGEGDEGEGDEGEGDGGEGDEGATTTVPDPTSVGDGERGSALDTPGATTAPEGPFAKPPPPAGVATGAQNPDGSGPADPPPPEPVTPDIVRGRIDDPRHSKFKPVPVATGISEELELYLTENPELFPTVVVERVTVRQYRYGALLAHVLGYVGSINTDELERFQNDEKPYENDDDIGKAGIEAGMERELRGTPGETVYEVDARNRPIRTVSQREPRPGRDVYLSVDINMQYLVEKGLAAEIERRRGKIDAGCFLKGCDPPGAASVAVDPRNGQVLAMASYPTYDPNLFVGGISREDYRAISIPEDEYLAANGGDREGFHDFPLLNRTIAGEYAPGSTFKLFSSFAALDNQLITPEERYNDTGIYRYSADCPVEREDNNCSARNAGSTAHGAVDLIDALRVSSDTYFYALGDESWRSRDRIGEEAMQRSMGAWGLGERTGIELPGERPGRIPTPEWLQEFSDRINAGNPAMAEEAGRWTPGVSGNIMVGQGDILTTPLQLAQGYATLANGGTIWKPQLVLQVTDYGSPDHVVVTQPEVTGQVDLPAEWRDPMIAGFDGVTKGPGGTATTAFGDFDQSQCPVAGKTGTAQVTGKNDTSLFTAFAPTPAPGRESVIAMATVFQEAGFGASAAVPLTRRVLEPFAAVGCDITRFGAAGSLWEAPLGGWFDVGDAQAEYVPPVPQLRD